MTLGPRPPRNRNPAEDDVSSLACLVVRSEFPPHSSVQVSTRIRSAMARWATSESKANITGPVLPAWWHVAAERWWHRAADQLTD
jgi:hypothetical protein